MALSIAGEKENELNRENPYEKLGVRKWATESEVKMAYIRMVKRYNPEAFPDEFILVRQAYERLRTPDRRAKVDILVFNELRGGIGYKDVERSTESLVKLNRQIQEYERAGNGAPLVGETRHQWLQLRRQRSLGYAEKGMWRDALKEWEEIQGLDRADRETRRNLVVGHARLAYQLAVRERFPEAVEHWDKALQFAPDTVELVHNLAIAATRTGNESREKELWGRTLALWNVRLKKDPENTYLKGLIVATHMYFGGELLGAEKATAQARAGVSRPSAALKPEERPEGTAATGPSTIPSGPFDSFTANKELGLACVDRKNWDAAIQAFQKCLAEKPDNMEVQNYLGWALLNSGDVDTAFRVWNKALKTDPSNKETRDNLVRGHLKVAKHLEKQRVWGPALVHLKSVLALDAKNPEVYARLGNVYFNRGDTMSAIEHWQKTLELDPKNREIKNTIRKAKQGLLR